MQGIMRKIIAISVLQLVLWNIAKPQTCHSPSQTNTNENRPIQLSTEKTLYDPYDVIEFSCPSGRYLQGHSSIECLRNGDWSAAVPQCLSTLNGSYCTEYKTYTVKRINEMCYYWSTGQPENYCDSKAKCLGDSHFPTLRSTEAIQRMGKIIYNEFPNMRFDLKFFTGLNAIDQENYRWQTGEIYEEVPNVNFQLNTWSPRWNIQVVQLSKSSTRETPVVNFASQYWPYRSDKISVMCEFLPNDYKDLVLVSETYAEYSGVFVKENGGYNKNKPVYKHKTKADTHLFFTGLYWCVGKFSYREANSCLYSLENEDILQIPWLTVSTRSKTDIYIKEQSASVSRWHTWGNWEECSGGYQTRSRTCQDFGMGGKLDCQGNDKDTRECDEWGPFTRCSKTCGNGEKTSFCISGPCSQKIRIESCNMSLCPEWSDWSACDKTCGGGVRSRTCSIEDACSGPKRELCNTMPCPPTCNSPVRTNTNENRPIQLSTEKALYDLYDVIEFSCPSGRYLQGHSSIECLRNSDWSAAVPQCLSTLNGGYCTEYERHKVKRINDMCYYWTTWKHKNYRDSKAMCLGDSHFPTLRSTEAIQRIGKIIYNEFPSTRFNLKFFTGLNSIDQENYMWQTGEIYEEVPNVNFQLNTGSPRWHVQIVQLSMGSTRETPVVIFASQYWPGASDKISVMCEFLPNDYKDLVLVSETYAEYSGVFVKENGVYNTNKPVYKHKTKTDTYLFYTGSYWCVGKFSFREANSCFYSLENKDILQIPWLTVSTRSKTDIYIKQQSASVSRWNAWGNWEECSGGYQTRSRTCQDFGMEGKLGCQGKNKDSVKCY